MNNLILRDRKEYNYENHFQHFLEMFENEQFSGRAKIIIQKCLNHWKSKIREEIVFFIRTRLFV